jgi:hypothetical protein
MGLGGGIPRSLHRSATKAHQSVIPTILPGIMEHLDDTSSNVSLNDLQYQCQRLPLEIRRMIMDIMLKDTFGPKMVHPYRDRTVANVFLALNRDLYRKQYKQYWSSNTWVIGKGSVNKTMLFMSERPYNIDITEYSRHRPNKAALNIQYVKLCFSRNDAQGPEDWLQVLELTQDGTLTRISNPYSMLEAFRTQCKYFKSVALRTWRDKFERVAVLNLRHLTLDLTEAYAPNGEFLGLEAVQWLIPFAHGIPDEFRILARTEALVNQIREIFDRKNS